MKRFLIACVMVLLLIPAAQAAEMERDDLRIELGPLFLWRVRSASYPLLCDNSPWTTNFETHELNEGALFGVQGEVEWAISNQWSIQLGAFWTAFSSHTLVDTSIGTVGDIDNTLYDQYEGEDMDSSNSNAIEAFEATMSSQVIGAEINVLTDYGLELPWLRYFVGFRYLHYTEHLETWSYDEMDDYLGTDDDIDIAEMRTWNNLYGGQVGVDLEVALLDNLTLGTDAWFALFLNSVSVYREFQVVNESNYDDYREQNMSGTFFAWGLGASPRLTWMPWENVGFTVGGEFILLQNVSEAGRYYQTITDFQNDTVAADNTVIFLGVNAGIMILF